MTEPQVWTLIGVFAASMFAMNTLMSNWFVRVLRAEVGGLRAEMRAEISGLRGEINARFERVDAQFERVDVKLAHLDRDVQALARAVFPGRES